MRLRVTHETRYSYEELVTTSQHQVHLTPRELPYQRCLSHEITIQPSPQKVRQRADYFGNTTCHFGIHEAHRSLTVVATSEVEVTRPRRDVAPPSLPWEIVREQVNRERRGALLDPFEFVLPSPHIAPNAEFRELALPSFTPGRAILEASFDLTRRIYREFTYDQAVTHVSTPVAEVFRLRRGVCQDYAQVQIACLRSLGLPARYVSGYLLAEPPAGAPRVVGALASHAWVSVFSPDVGWVDFDPVNDLIPSEGHITLAFGREFSDVTPLRGVIQGGGGHTLHVAVDVVCRDEPATEGARESALK